jgi:hypothetical protein
MKIVKRERREKKKNVRGKEEGLGLGKQDKHTIPFTLFRFIQNYFIFVYCYFYFQTLYITQPRIVRKHLLHYTPIPF